MQKEAVNHPAHYGGDVPYEAIKVIEDWGLGFSAGNAVKYMIRAPHKGSQRVDLEKAVWYLRRAYSSREPIVRARPPALFPSSVAEFWKLDQNQHAALVCIFYGNFLDSGCLIATSLDDVPVALSAEGTAAALLAAGPEGAAASLMQTVLELKK